MITDVRYSVYLKLATDSEVLHPTVIEVRRPYDKYSAEINLLPESVEFNVADLPASAFVLENTEKLPITNLVLSQIICERTAKPQASRLVATVVACKAPCQA